MSPFDFVRQLAAVAPSIESLAKVGITAADAARIQQSFSCVQRTRFDRMPPDDDAIALVEAWDASRVEIGVLRFSSRSQPVSVGTQIGSVETDALIVKPSHGEVVVVEGPVSEHILWHAAQDGGKLLDTLLNAAQFLTKRMIEQIDFEDLNAAHMEANRCALAAGGEEYHSFYSMLLGVDA